MIRPPYKTQKIVKAEIVRDPETNAKREKLKLACGHELLQAPREVKRKRAYCPECNEPKNDS